MVELQSYIQSYFEITDAEANILQKLFVKEVIDKEDSFLRERLSCEKMSYVKSGYLRVYASTAEKDVTQWIASAGQFITDMSGFFFNLSAKWNIEPVAETVLYTIHKKEYLTLFDTIPQWERIEKQLIGKCFIMLENRVFSHLSLSAEERYDQFFHLFPEMFNHVPLIYIASMLGMTPETLSRIRSKKSS